MNFNRKHRLKKRIENGEVQLWPDSRLIYNNILAMPLENRCQHVGISWPA